MSIARRHEPLLMGSQYALYRHRADARFRSDSPDAQAALL
jgi:hypothetical protein